MKVFRAIRRIVAIVTGVVLLSCQTVALARACTTDSVRDGTPVAAAMPCHEAVEDADTRSHPPAAPSVCDASNALPQTDKAPAFALPDIPVLVVAAHDAMPPLQYGLPPAVHVVCSSPPLTVLHCRFLN